MDSFIKMHKENPRILWMHEAMHLISQRTHRIYETMPLAEQHQDLARASIEVVSAVFGAIGLRCAFARTLGFFLKVRVALSVPQHQRHADRRAVHRIQTGLPPSCLLISRRGHLQLRRIDFIDLLAFVRLADAAGCSSCIAAVLLGAKEGCGRAGESESTRSPSPDGPGRPLGPPRLGPRGPPH